MSEQNTPRRITLQPETKRKVKSAAHEYANPKTKVIQSYCRLHDAFEAGALWAITELKEQIIWKDRIIKNEN